MGHVVIKPTFILFSLCLFLISSHRGGANLQPKPPQVVGTFGEWSVYTAVEEGNKICFMVSYPQKTEFLRKADQNKNRGDIYMIISHRPYQNDGCNIVSVNFGYPLKPGHNVKLNVDQKTFDMFTDQETAWAPPGRDATITRALLQGKSLVIKGESSRGTPTQDTYSLDGSAKAYKEMCQVCGVTKQNLTINPSR